MLFRSREFQVAWDGLSLDWVHPGEEFLPELFQNMGMGQDEALVHSSDCCAILT